MSTYLSVNGVPVKRGEVSVQYNVPVRRLIFSHPYNTSAFEIGIFVTAIIHHNGQDTKLFEGTIKSVTRKRPDMTFEFMAEDILQKAIEYWFAPTNIDEGYTWSNINHLNLTKALLAYAQIGAGLIIDDWTPYPTFQFAIGPEPVKISVANCWDTIGYICAVTGMHVYADTDGYVHLTRIWDEPGATVSFYARTGNSGNAKSIEYNASDENLRNKIAVYGRNGVTASASAVSPYVPNGFWKTAIISSELIDDGSMAQQVADLNLPRLNKLTEALIMEVIGDAALDCRQTIDAYDPRIGVAGKWFVNQISHRVDSSGGYTCRLTCKK